MNVEISTEAAQFPGKEYKNGFSLQCVPRPCNLCFLFTTRRQTWTLHIPAQEEYKKCDFPTLNKQAWKCPWVQYLAIYFGEKIDTTVKPSTGFEVLLQYMTVDPEMRASENRICSV